VREKKVYFDNGRGRKLSGILTEPQNILPNSPIVLMCHGLSSCKERLLPLAADLIEKNIAVFRFDFFGHGESDGAFENLTLSECVRDVLQAFQYLKDNKSQRIGLFGSSFGGLSSVLAAAQLPELNYLALRAPIWDPKEKVLSDYPESFVEKWKREQFTDFNGQKLGYGLFEDFYLHDAYHAVSQLTCPVFVVHGDQDESAPFQQTQKAVSLARRGELVVIPGGDHRFSDERLFNQMIKNIAQFIEKQVKNGE